MQLKAETRHLVEKHLKRALHPWEIVLSALLSVATFAITYRCRCSEMRYVNEGNGLAIVLLVAVVVLVVALAAVQKYRLHKPCRSWVSLAVVLPCSYALGLFFGEQYWNKALIGAYTWNDMATYVNIDPARDRGQSFMDAGTVYFRDGAYVLKSHSIAFRNGHVYCVAPIVRADPNATHLKKVNGFALPQSGTVDFWAVGVDCCGEEGNEFHCADADSPYARSGVRALDEMARSMYLLGVQEWSATTGLPVRHPLFFSWVLDPIAHPEGIIEDGEKLFLQRLGCCFFASLFAGYFIHILLQKLRVN